VRSSLLLLTLTGCATAGLPVTTPAPPSVRAPTLAVDTHLHLSMHRAARPIFQGEPGSGALSTNPGNRWVNAVDEGSLREHGVKLVYGAVWPPFAGRPGRTAFDEAVNQVRGLDLFTLEHPGFALVRSAAEARRAIARGAIAVLPQLEGGEGLRSVADLDALYLEGVRCMTLVHFVGNDLGGAAVGQLARALLHQDVRDRVKEPQGLTPLGRAIVTRMMDLGIVIDLAHASDVLAADVLTMTEARGVPVIISHTGSRALSGMERNLPDDLARRVVASGGLLGLSLFVDQLEVPDHTPPWPGAVPRSCDDVVAHWLHFAALVGHDALVLGTDDNGTTVRAGPGGLCPDGLGTSRELGGLWNALASKGVPTDALDSQGERLLGLIEKVEKKALPPAQRGALGRASRVDSFPR
jgi:membrane dipeptidase